MLFCQDKEIGVEAMERKRIEYIDWLRIISAIAVIGIHITMTQPNNYSVQEIGKSNYTILTCVYTLIQWAVPVFLMISGNLLLHSNKLAFTKVKKMSLRMGAVLLLFGSAFALLEQVFERKTLERNRNATKFSADDSSTEKLVASLVFIYSNWYLLDSYSFEEIYR